MLVISRKLGESFFVGDNIEIRILSIKSDNIKIGINAPKDVKIARSELIETKNSNREAALSLGEDGDADAIVEKILSNKI